MGILKWAGLRQVYALHDSVDWSLWQPGLRDSEEEALKWVQEQGLPDAGHSHARLKAGFGMLLAFEERVGYSLGGLAKRSEYNHEDIGVERSGAGWTDVPNFIITSAFVRLLGASEQFELDVLKALLYYRPDGRMASLSSNGAHQVESKVALEQPEISGDKEIYTMPALWTWIKKPAENNPERRKIFSNVFGIKTIPEGYTGSQRDGWYEKRNAIAHGRRRVVMTLGEYVAVEVYVTKSILYIAEQCEREHKLIV